jgi:hypothetical protein
MEFTIEKNDQGQWNAVSLARTVRVYWHSELIKDGFTDDHFEGMGLCRFDRGFPNSKIVSGNRPGDTLYMKLADEYLSPHP